VNVACKGNFSARHFGHARNKFFGLDLGFANLDYKLYGWNYNAGRKVAILQFGSQIILYLNTEHRTQFSLFKSKFH